MSGRALGTAWDLALRALPSNWSLIGLVYVLTGDEWRWQASAHNRPHQLAGHPNERFASKAAIGSTPILALTELAAKLSANPGIQVRGNVFIDVGESGVRVG